MNPRRATFLLAIANALGRITGLAREIAFSAVFGAGMVTDAFNAAVRVPQLLRELLAEGSLQNALVPSFVEVSERKGLEEAWKLASAALGLLLVFLGTATLCFFVAAPAFVSLIAEGFSESPEKRALTITLVRWLSPFLMGLSLAGFCGGILNARGKFFLPAISQNILNLVVFIACLLAPWWEKQTGQPAIIAVALATTASGFLQLLVVVPPLIKEGFSGLPRFHWHPELSRMLRAFGPALVGISTVQLSLLIESQWAAHYGDGPLSWLYLSFRLVQIPLTLVSGSVATASLAALSLHIARQEHAAFSDTLSKAIRLNAFLVLPCAAAFVVLAEPLTRFCFERGAFSPEDTAGTARMLQMYGLAAFGICFHRIAVPVYYALNKPKVAAYLSMMALITKLPVIYLLTRGLGMGPEALPLSHAITVGGEAVALAWGLRSYLAPDILNAHLKMLLATGLMAAVLWEIAPALPLPLTCLVGGLCYLGTSLVLGLPEIRSLIARRPRGLPPTIDADTQAALQALSLGEIFVEGSQISNRHGQWKMVARAGVLSLEPAGAAHIGNLNGDVFAVMRIGQGPPMLRGLIIGDQGWRADGDQIQAGLAEGPRIPVLRT